MNAGIRIQQFPHVSSLLKPIGESKGDDEQKALSIVSGFVWFLQAAIKIAEAEWSKNTVPESKSSISEDQHD